MTTLLNKLAPCVAKLAASKSMKLLREDYDPSSFGNAVIELSSVDLDLRVVRDRDDVRIEVKPLDGEDWHNLITVLAFFGEKPTAVDVDSLGAALSARYDQVAALMTSDLTRVGFIGFERAQAASFLRTLFPSKHERN